MNRTSSHAPLLLATVVALAGAVAVGSTAPGNASGSATTATAAAAAVTGYDLPFTCGQTWTGGTRSGHSPSREAIDFNRPDDEGSAVVAAERGTVSTAVTVDRGGYGRYVVVDHGNGASTLYGHLKTVTVQAGQPVDKGALLGALGSSGNASGAHLHFEQRVSRSVVAAVLAGVAWRSGAAVSANCVDVPLAADLGGDRVSELLVFRRVRASSFEAMPSVTYAGGSTRFGAPSDEPVTGDWDGDGRDDLGVRSPRTAVFKLALATGVTRLRYGVVGDRPVAGDWDGDGTSEVGVRRASTASFHLRAADGATSTVRLGDANDVPVTGDWNGDGTTDLGVYDPATSVFTLRVATPGVAPWTVAVPFGTVGDLPVVGDWDGNGTSDVGTWTPSSAVFVQRQAPLATGVARSVTSAPWGTPRR